MPVSYVPPVCMICENRATFTRKCIAYPDGIPDDIWLRLDEHLEPRGDEVDGITLETTPEKLERWRRRRDITLVALMVGT
ncbi:MAG: hypothetical protein D6685_16230 [Bacteroidetes bacterium]|nr:MAG: hypothetical protein D6685_16230 [Bacteroidota bacterium]